MKTTIKFKEELHIVDFSKPIDISIPLSADAKNPLAWYLEKPEIEPVKLDDWVGSVEKGASVNFNNIAFNPHAHGTHTECVGHISKDFNSVNKALKEFFFIAHLVSVVPVTIDGDEVITGFQIKKALQGKRPQALIIRTVPNSVSKKTRKYSNKGWPFLAEEAATYLCKLGVEHLLIDLPSVDKEKDGGALKAHKAFWNYPKNTRHQATITEFIFVPNKVKDGAYVLNLQTAPFENDATPSRPVLYRIL